MGKNSNPAAATIIREIRAALDDRAEDKARVGQQKGSIKVLGVRPASVKTVAREVAVKHRMDLDYGGCVDVLEVAAARKTREEVLVTVELMERCRKDFEPSLIGRLDKWIGLADDLELAEALGARLGAPALSLDPGKIATVRKWARFRSVGRKRMALLTAAGLVTEGRRDAALALDLCEILLNEDHPILVGEVASLLKTTTKIDAKAVQDFLFRRSVDGNPDILRAGSENLDAARRAALIAKLEAQATVSSSLATAGGR